MSNKRFRGNARSVVLGMVVVVMPLTLLAGKAPAAETVRDIGSKLTLFVDHWMIDRMTDTRLKLHSPVRKEIVFVFDKPWEGGLSSYITLLKDGDDYRMYYRGGGDLVREYTCVAFSHDGIHWTRPSLGLFECKGSKDNNIIWTGKRKAYDESHNFSPFIDENPETPASQRYKAVTLARIYPGGKKKNVLIALVSSDGVHWKKLRDEPVITEGGFDSHNTAFWDTDRKRYVCYSRAGQQGKKSVSRCTSPDFVNWTEPVLLAFGDTVMEHFYTNGILPYYRAPHLYLGFPMRFIHPLDRNTLGFEQAKVDGLSDAVFMSSHDGLHWNRPFMEAFLRPGLDQGNWGGAHGNNTPSWGLVRTSERENSIYWAENYDNYPEDTGRIPRLCRGAIRLDGFASVNAPYAGGEMVTRPLSFEGKHLVINVSTSAPGSVKVEIQDKSGKPIPGFGLDDCIEIWGDQLERTVAWKRGHDVSRLAGKPVRLRFVMADADLYAIQFHKPDEIDE